MKKHIGKALRRTLLALLVAAPLTAEAQVAAQEQAATTAQAATPQERTDAMVADSASHEVLLETSMGSVRVALSDLTPLHRDNFLRLVRAGYYDGTLFHRIIKDFMVQGGDSTTRHARPGARLGGYSPNYTVPAEFRFPRLFHRRGALAAAREGDSVNPGRASSSAQFYIVWGYEFNQPTLDRVQQRLDERTDSTVRLTPAVRQAYCTEGGTPHLDGQYTVFGWVTEGLDVVERMQAVPTDDNDRPNEDVRILRATVVR